jgi:hypothetical protein
MKDIRGVGLGLRNEFIEDMNASSENVCDFLEIAPENWMAIGGRRKKTLKELSARYPIIAHGLSLSLGGPDPIDKQFLDELKVFFKEHNVALYSEHVSYSGDEQGLLYDLLPMPFTEEAIFHIASRIKQVQDILGRRIAVENVSYYSAPGQKIAEVDFMNGILAEADCELLLDINNVYVNSVNHGYSPKAFIDALNLNAVAYVHMAGHLKEHDNLLIDTHGKPIASEVMDLLAYFYTHYGVHPTLIERDNNIPPLKEMLIELDSIKALQKEEVPARV